MENLESERYVDDFQIGKQRDKLDEADSSTLHQSKEGAGIGGIQCPLVDILSYRTMSSVLAFFKGEDFDVSNIQTNLFLTIIIEYRHQGIISNGVNDDTSHILVAIY